MKILVYTTFAYIRRQLHEFLMLKMQQRCLASDDSDDSSGSDEELVAVVCELVLAPKTARGALLNLEDLSPLECEQLFRYTLLLSK